MSVLHSSGAANIVAKPIDSKPKRTPPTLSTELRKEIAKARKAKQEVVEAKICAWYEKATAEAEAMAREHGKNAQYYLNMMFSASAKLEKTRKVNPYNAWLHSLAQDNAGMSRLSGSISHTFSYFTDTLQDGVDVVELGHENIDEYEKLTDEQKAKLVQALEEEKKSQTHGLRLGQRGRSKDVSNTCATIEEIVRCTMFYSHLNAQC